MFTKILIANRGEIACRIAATARRMGLRTVAVYSSADADAAHVQACDEAVWIGEAPARDSYLQVDRILAAAQATGAQAIHPGYGFLSENTGLAQACADHGLTWIGPPPSAIGAMGSKSAAKALMQAAGVPLVPGYHGDQQDAGFLQAQADRIGYPVLIKATAGGGGKGMRIVEQPGDFDAALQSCQREAQASFGDSQVLLERYLTRARHIEIQLMADQHGHVVHLFERDCSVQRRHQKVLEEAPAPGMSDARRAEMGQAAVAAARSVGYVGAGTVEFIVETGATAGDEGRFYFMEMNTRLQVEHPVTEAITGLDLVEWQLRVAAGEPLPWQQQDLAARGHAIEARLCAEQPANQFLPSTGRLHVLRAPPCTRFEIGPVRLDSGVREGDEITAHYDSMIGKLIVWGEDRPQALQRLDAALRALHIAGPHNNVGFLRRLIHTRTFVEADLDTALIVREHKALFDELDEENHAPWWPLAAAAAHLLTGLGAAQPALRDPWSRPDGWRLHGRARHALTLEVDDLSIEAHLAWLDDGRFELQWQGQSRVLQLHPALPGQRDHHVDLTLGTQRQRLAIYAVGAPNSLHVFVPLATEPWRVRFTDPLNRRQAHAHDTGRLTAPMPGRVLAVLVEVGQAVKRGQSVAVTEAMKMEHTLTAPHDGIVTALWCQAGDLVTEGMALLSLDALDAPQQETTT